MSDKESIPNAAAEDARPLHEPDIHAIPIDDYLDGVRDDPITLTGMARDPFERVILEQAKWFHDHADTYMRLAVRAPSPLDDAYVEKAMQCSSAVVRLHESFRKHRGRGEQKVIVEYRTPHATAERAKRDLRRTAPRADANRVGGKARAG